MNQDKIGKFISKIRKEKGMTQAELGEKVGVSSKAVSKWECGKTLPDISILIALSETLEVNIAELLKGERIEDITGEDINEATNKSVRFYEKITKKKFSKIILLLCSLLFIITFFVLSIFVINNYDSCNLYSVISTEDNLYISGNVIVTDSKTTFTFGNLFEDSKFNFDSIEKYKYFVMYDNDILFKKTIAVENLNSGFLKNLIINFEKDNINFSEFGNLKLRIVMYYNNGEEPTKIEIPLKIEKQFSNSRLFY